MRRRYKWLILAAIMGLILAAAPTPDHSRQPKPDVTTQTIADRPQKLNSTIEKLPNSHAPDYGCPDGRDNKNSDLCAQWKAADAAADSAQWALFGLLIGAGTLIAAVFAARYAKEAAKHTETGATAAIEGLRVAKNAYASENRPALTFTGRLVDKGVKGDLDDPAWTELTIFVRNVGTGPARVQKLAMTASQVWRDYPTPIDTSCRFPRKRYDLFIGAGQVEQFANTNFERTIDRPETHRTFVRGSIEYADFAGMEWITYFMVAGAGECLNMEGDERYNRTDEATPDEISAQPLAGHALE